MAISDAHKTNFETLQVAIKEEDACLLEVYDRLTGEPAVMLCATYKDEDGNITFVPMARVLDSDPYDSYVTEQENVAKYLGQVDHTRVVVLPEGQPLNLYLHLVNHSPDGFNWGYGGSGPAQLALALLAHHLELKNDPGAYVRAQQHYEQFKREVIAQFPQGEPWTLSTLELDAWLAHAEGREQEKPEGNGLVNPFGQPISSGRDTP